MLIVAHWPPTDTQVINFFQIKNSSPSLGVCDDIGIMSDCAYLSVMMAVDSNRTQAHHSHTMAISFAANSRNRIVWSISV